MTAAAELSGDHGYEVSPRIVAGFCAAAGETDRLCLDPSTARDAGFAGVVAPPGFAFMVTYPLGIAVVNAAGIDPERITHVAESQRLTRPIVGGDVLYGTASVTVSRTTAAGMGVLSWQVAVTDQCGNPVCQTSSTVFIRPDDGWPEPRQTAAVEQLAATGRDSFTVDRGHVARYCGISGDAHPVHWSDRAARRSGLGGIIMHGSLLLAVVARTATRISGTVAGVTEVGARFAAPVEVPDDDHGVTLDVSASPPDDTGTLALTVHVGGRPVLASARAAIRRS